ncbi:hypothetical protein [Mycolicibacterium conceptionense]|uniref:hypothetical protein n=1 Tax=Mycolicibacterium conceptionense TaxID=451644 RepID=UPI000AC6B563|nr:hypothetical protein [Mycolicibacterium conceptionense]
MIPKFQASILDDRPLTAAENLLLQEAVEGAQGRKHEQAPVTGAQGWEREQTPAELICGRQGGMKRFFAEWVHDLYVTAGWTVEHSDHITVYTPPAGMSHEEAERFNDLVRLRVFGVLPREFSGDGAA